LLYAEPCRADAVFDRTGGPVPAGPDALVFGLGLPVGLPDAQLSGDGEVGLAPPGGTTAAKLMWAASLAACGVSLAAGPSAGASGLDVAPAGLDPLGVGEGLTLGEGLGLGLTLGEGLGVALTLGGGLVGAVLGLALPVELAGAGVVGLQVGVAVPVPLTLRLGKMPVAEAGLLSGFPWPFTPALPTPSPGPPPGMVWTSAPDDEMTCGRYVRAKAPMATTKTAVPMAAAGRSHA
jgi:hypothetical protein